MRFWIVPHRRVAARPGGSPGAAGVDHLHPRPRTNHPPPGNPPAPPPPHPPHPAAAHRPARGPAPPRGPPSHRPPPAPAPPPPARRRAPPRAPPPPPRHPPPDLRLVIAHREHGRLRTPSAPPGGSAKRRPGGPA